MNIVEKMKADWNRRASHGARYWIATEDYSTEESFDRSGQQTALAMVTLLELEAGGLSEWHVLDIGCGVGRVLKPMASRVRSIVGIDVSKEMIAGSKERLEGLSNATTLESSGVDLADFADGRFDLVYSYVAFQHMPRPVFHRYLDEAHRVLRDDGWLVFQLYVGAHREPPLGDTISLRVYDESELETLLRERGFRIERKTLEHRAGDAIESWLVLAKRLATNTAAGDEAWIEQDCADERSPLDDHLYRNLVRNQLAEGDRTAAIETMKQHLEFDPKALSVGLDLAAMLIEEGRAEEAMEVLAALTERHPDYPDAYLVLLQLQIRAGLTADADRLHARLTERFSGEPLVRARASRIVAGPGEPPG